MTGEKSENEGKGLLYIEGFGVAKYETIRSMIGEITISTGIFFRQK